MTLILRMERFRGYSRFGSIINDKPVITARMLGASL
jgi:hypothetical protein